MLGRKVRLSEFYVGGVEERRDGVLGRGILVFRVFFIVSGFIIGDVLLVRIEVVFVECRVLCCFRRGYKGSFLVFVF